jgi:hypothetical protein
VISDELLLSAMSGSSWNDLNGSEYIQGGLVAYLDTIYMVVRLEGAKVISDVPRLCTTTYCVDHQEKKCRGAQMPERLMTVVAPYHYCD